MGTETLTTYSSTGISLSTAGAYQTPFTITQTGTVNVASGNAVYSGVTGVVLLNEGLISAPADGVYFQNGGTVTNAAGGVITGQEAVRLGNGGGVVDPGLDQQSLANAGLIAGTADGVFVRGSVSSVINTGTITGGAAGSGMYLLGGGYIGNSGTFAGNYGVHWVDDPAIALTFNSTGTIFGTDIGLAAGGDGNQTITNQNIIYGGFTGVILSDGGSSLDTLINTGTIFSKASDFGVRTDTFGNAAIFNQGTIEEGVRLQDTATNIDFLRNAGSINGFAGVDVYNASGSQTIINTGVITGSGYGIRLGTSASSTTTIENAGTIASTSGPAIGTQSSDAGALTLIIDPNAVFTGQVEAAAGAANTLELAPGAGSLSGLGIQFTNFDAITVESGGAWTLSAANTLAGAIGVPGPFPAGNGGAGVALQAGAYLYTAGTFSGGAGGAGSPSVPGANGGTGGDLGDGATLVNAGTLAGGAGGYGTSDGGFGGTGALLNTNASLDNQGRITGGLGGGSATFGGGGGFGVFLDTGTSLANAGQISGGAGESNGVTDYNGATGAYLGAGSALTNAAAGLILGGDGGAGTFGKSGGIGLNLATQFVTFSGVVTLVSAGSLSNFGQIIGGNGGYGNDGGDGGSGGSGIRADTFATFANHGTIAGGGGANGGNYAGAGGYGLGLDPFATLDNLGLIEGASGGMGRVSGYGGDGVIVRSADAVIINEQNITGGNAGYGTQYSGNGGIGVELQSGSTLLNLGTITGGNAGALATTGIRAGSAGAGVLVYNQAGGSQTIVNHGTIIGGSYGIRLQTTATSSTTIENDGTIASSSGDAIGTFGTDDGPLTLIVDPGAAFIGSVTGAGGVLEFAAGTGSLAGLGAQFFDFATFALDAGASWSVSGTLTSSADEVITGFTRHDTIDITNLTTPPDSRVTLSGNDVLSLEQDSNILNLTFAGDSGLVLTLTSDGASGTDITATNAICYVRGTRILTPAGEVRVEALRIGDALVTRFGGVRRIRWIGEQTYDWRFVRQNVDKIPVRIAPGALGDGMPARDLAISPGHSVLLGNTLVLARDLVNGVTITQQAERDTGVLEYFQIELDTHDCVLAEGCWAETYADAPGLRAQFHNAGSYAALYPDAPPPVGLELCAERPERGPKLAAALRPVVAQAWAGVTTGKLEGWLERAGAWRVEGWALDQAHPVLPVLMEVWLGERLLGTVLAHAARGDLAAAGKGNCAFCFTSPVRLKPQDRRLLSIRRASDGAELPRLWERAA